MIKYILTIALMLSITLVRAQDDPKVQSAEIIFTELTYDGYDAEKKVLTNVVLTYKVLGNNKAYELPTFTIGYFCMKPGISASRPKPMFEKTQEGIKHGTTHTVTIEEFDVSSIADDKSNAYTLYCTINYDEAVEENAANNSGRALMQVNF